MQLPLLHENTTVDALVWMAIVFVATWIVVKATMLAARRLARDRWNEWIDAGLNAVDGPLLLGFPAMAVLAAVPATRVQQTAVEAVRHGATIAAIISAGWLFVAVTLVARRVVERRYRMEVADNRAARAVNTKFRLLTRILIILVTVVTAGAVLTTFPSIRTLGAGLLASAGVAGLVIGLAARPFVENVLASIQIAMTEPINLDDVLIVEGEWGRVEEIGATYVVMRIWDDRRLVIPLTYFLTRPFQNWTRHTADITGVVTVTVDYRTPVDRVRDALVPIIEGHPKWDGRFWNVQITDADARGMTLRVLCTAADASRAWDLRCDVRESLIAWLNSNHPDCLPRVRAELDGAERDASAATLV
ncbi:mechanosensitive ion channel family protein [Lentisalinibacter sediminis]|uniref:mechanosensitive ion channel family protein n=1 Tax=Lentisalinibacter sediminis TaxID=2992237 RepID=UPI0038663FA5